MFAHNHVCPDADDGDFLDLLTDDFSSLGAPPGSLRTQQRRVRG